MFKLMKCIISPTKIKNISEMVFGKYLLQTNIVSGGALLWLGDICEQEIEFRQGKLAKRYDYGRMARMFTVGIVLGPLNHYYYLNLAKVLPKRNLATVFSKICLDEFLMSPVCIVAFFYSMGVLEMKPIQKMNEELVDKFLEVYKMDWCIWVPAQFVNFYFVPVKYQVFYINAVTALYNIFLSYIKHKAIEPLATNKSNNT
ncbi:unnamed protein product [Ceutorhynchus assimilis]|uniref:Mpv17-like protein 2 n=1 Tax=Ceutorhynchus assimilis TaxID=467358 RepID=A0A9N9MXT2_9CUCU|nr:unnamed protein product [Ceutorhynchus assimilis]